MDLSAVKNLKVTQSQLGRVCSDEAVFTREFTGAGGAGMQRSKHRWHPAQTLVTPTVESNPRAVRGFKNQVPVRADKDKEPLGFPCLLP